MTSLALIASVRLYREGLVALFRDDPRFDIVAVATALDEALDAVQRAQPNVVLAVRSAREGPSLVGELVAAAPETRVVILGIDDDDPDVLPLAEAGVAGYVTTDATGDEIVAVVESVSRGEMPCSPRLAAALLSRVRALAHERDSPDALAALTAREREIVQLLGRGLSNKEIAHALRIEVTTVKNHVHSILEKLNVSRRADAAALARRES